MTERKGPGNLIKKPWCINGTDGDHTVVINDQIDLDLEFQKEIEKAEKMKKKLLPETPPKVNFDNYISESYTVVDVQGVDRVGFLYSISHAISSLDLSIFFAKISTEKAATNLSIIWA